MKKIRIYCLHPEINSVSDLVKYLHIKDLSIITGMIWDEINPDYLIVSEHIYFKPKYKKEFCKYVNRKDIIFIFLAGECIAPDLNIFDYAIVFDRKLIDMDRIGRIPTNFFFRDSMISLNNDISEIEASDELNNRKFCNFIYSNPNADPMRDFLFYEISKYKKVDSLGAHLNNVGNKTTRYDRNWREISIKQKSNYKFTIACENASYEGYTSEKLLTSFQAHSIPIYWGNPYIEEEYNGNAFINCNKYNNINDIVKIIKEIDSNDSMWKKMVSEPWQTKEQVLQMNKEMQDYLEFINNIFTQPLSMARRRPRGTVPSIYLRSFTYKYSLFDIYKEKIVRKIIKKDVKND